MAEPHYYVKHVRRDDNGRITRMKTSKELQDRPEKVRRRKKVAKHVKNGKHIRTAFLEDGEWVNGSRLVLNKDKELRAEGNTEGRDNLGNLPSF